MNQAPPNIVFIVMDNVGAKRMSLYGYHRQTTPHLERLAAECRVYSRCFAPACWTIPSHASMFTGLYPSQHGAYEGKSCLGDNVQHLVSVLKMAGYHTLGISANGLISPETGLCRDFDYFLDFGALDLKEFLSLYERQEGQPVSGSHPDLSTRLDQAVTITDKARILLDHILETRQFAEVFAKASQSLKARLASLVRPATPTRNSAVFTKKIIRLCRDLLRWDSVRNKQPFFLFINFLEAHERYNPPLKFRKFSRWHDRQVVSCHDLHKQNSADLQRLMQKYGNLYDDELVYLDTILYELWTILKKLPTFDNTVIIFTSDHGEHFGEKQMYNHIFSLYNELIWVPLMIRFPGETNLKGRDDRLASLNDLYGTILDLIQSPLPVPQDSVSLCGSSHRDFAISQHIYPEFFQDLLEVVGTIRQDQDFSPHLMAVVSASGKKIIEKRDGNLEIYDLGRDMAETRNLAPALSPQDMKNCRSLMELLKQETNFSEAVEARDTAKRNSRPTGEIP